MKASVGALGEELGGEEKGFPDGRACGGTSTEAAMVGTGSSQSPQNQKTTRPLQEGRDSVTDGLALSHLSLKKE